jgi:hypothetical protein
MGEGKTGLKCMILIGVDDWKLVGATEALGSV